MANTTNLDLVKPLGTDHALISVINGNMDKVDAYAGKVNDSLAGVQDGLAIVAVGDTHAAITSGQYVYVKDHSTLPEGMYTASSNIAANGALSTSNLTAVSSGALNVLSDHIASLIKTATISGTTDAYGNLVLNNYATSAYTIIGAYPNRAAATTMSFVGVSTNATQDKFMLHFENNSGSAFASASAEATIIYMTK